jgi:hypothetical protein
LVVSFLIILILFLVSSFITLLEDDITVKLEVEDHLFNHIISLEKPVLVREFGQVVRGLRVV